MKEEKEEKNNNNDKNQENMDNNFFDRDDIFISICKNNIVKYCRKCHRYIIIILKNEKMQAHQCLYCEEKGKLQNIFVDDAKIYFNDKKSVTNNIIINKNNDNPIYQTTKYSSSYITIPNE